MGAKNSQIVSEQIRDVLDQYEVLQENTFENLTYLEHKKTGKEYLLREMTFNDKNEYNRSFETLQRKKNELDGCEHVVPLVKYLTKSEDQFCSTFYKIYALFEYPQRTLDDEISQRNLQKRRFQEKQLWSILASCILGLSHLQKQGIKHSSLRSINILLSPQGVIKIADPFTTASLPNYDILITKRQAAHIYLSPEQTESIQKQMTSCPCNPYKADIWSLGMIMLEAGLLQYQDECYRDEGSRIHWETLSYNINRFGQSYSEDLRSMVEFMLSKDERSRPQWVELEEHVMKVDEGVRGSYVVGDNNNTGFNNNNKGSSPGAGYPPSGRFNPNFVQNNSNLGQHNSNFGQNNSTFGQGNPTTTAHFNNSFPSNNRPVDYHRTMDSNYTNSRYDNPVATNPYQSYSPQYNQKDSFVPVKPSNIESTRPNRNVFPANAYVEHTKIDENLIMVEEEEDNNRRFASGNQYSQSKIHEHSAPAQNQFQPTRHQNYYQHNQPIGYRDNLGMTSSTKKSSEHNNVSANNNGQAQYKVEIFKMGSKYEGYKLNGMRHGQGKFYYQDGGMYDGEWNFNRMEGYGKLYYQSGKLAYEGQWIRDQFTGYGVLYNENPDKLFKPFDYKNFQEIDDYWTKYEGNFFEDNKHGKGSLYLSNDERFQGQFNNDFIHGKGTYYTMNRKVITGMWDNNHYLQ